MTHTLFFDKFGFESAFDHTQGENVVETYEATQVTRSLWTGRKIDQYKDGRLFQRVYSMESGYDGEQELKHVATIDHSEKSFSSVFGYFTPHPTGKIVHRYLRGQGFQKQGE